MSDHTDPDRETETDPDDPELPPTPDAAAGQDQADYRADSSGSTADLPDEWDPQATVTLEDGETVRTSDFSVQDVSLDLGENGTDMDNVSIGLSDADQEHSFQATIEVPTKTLVCNNCGAANAVPVWSFVQVDFGGDLEHLSGEYAMGHQCKRCGFPY